MTNDSFKEYQGFNLAAFDDRYLEASDNVDIFKALKTEKISSFKQQLVDYYKVEPEKFRLWTILYRQNKTVRVDQPLSVPNERMSKFLQIYKFAIVTNAISAVEKMRENTCASSLNNGFTKFYMELAEKDKPLPVLKNDQMLVFVKFFDVKQQRLR